MVSPLESATKLEHKGYNRGLILGLTMAESMLLLVFCLLLVAGAIIKAERQKASNSEAKVNAATIEIRQLSDQVREYGQNEKKLSDRIAALENQLLQAGVAGADREKLEKEWRELVSAKETLNQYVAQGLSPEAVGKAKDAFERMQSLGLETTDVATLIARLRYLVEGEKQKSQSKPHEWPPIINLSEAGGYFFKSGSAELTAAFTSKLRGSIAAQIAENLALYDVDIIEVIGHTDEQPISRTGSNLDKNIIDVVEGKQPITAIIPADNAGLGMARAVAVVNVLKSDQRLSGATILPMSGAQLVLPGDRLTKGQAGDVMERRRIEIRIRRRNSD